jgi:D-lactate dehydrogenase
VAVHSSIIDVILYFVATEPDEQPYYVDALPDDDVRFVCSLADVEPDADALCIFIDSTIDDGFLSVHPNLRFITTRTSGFEHVNVEACRARNVVVSYVPVYGETTVAEHTFALILALSRRLREAMELPHRGQFSYSAARGFDLAGKTLGVIGLGRIGQRVARLGRCFEMRVIGCDPFEMSAEFAAKHDLEFKSLEDVLRESDVVTLHVKLSELTRHMLNRESMALCRPGVLIVNTARGALIDTLALQECLDSGQVGGVGLDVLEDERILRKPVTDIISDQIVEHLQSDTVPEEVSSKNRLQDLQGIVSGNALLRRSNVVFTPHIAFNSVEAVEKLREITVENIRAFKAGNPQNRA